MLSHTYSDIFIHVEHDANVSLSFIYIFRRVCICKSIRIVRGTANCSGRSILSLDLSGPYICVSRLLCVCLSIFVSKLNHLLLDSIQSSLRGHCERSFFSRVFHCAFSSPLCLFIVSGFSSFPFRISVCYDIVGDLPILRYIAQEQQNTDCFI